jgi:ABC-2 type transport system ATP-binding protein
MPPAIEVRDLVKSYGSHNAVDGISLEVESGEIFGFLGPNGAGKTTTIEILEGYRGRTSGDVRVLGADPAHTDRRLRDRIGLVLQESELDPLLTVRETLTLFAVFYERPRPVDEVIGLVGLDDKRDARVGKLSGGQRRRADVAVALIGDPDLIFLDEPTTGFDPTARREAWTMIEGLKALGKTVFLTTHYMDEAQHLADRVAILRAGRIVATGKPDELGGATLGATTVSFRLPSGLAVADLQGVLELPVDLSGDIASVETRDAQATLFRLTSYAEREHLRLERLEAQQPTLEDVFLDLTSTEDTHA